MWGGGGRGGRTARLVAAVSVRHARRRVAVACGLTLLLGIAGSGLEADNRIVDSLPAGAAAAQALARVDSDFGGAMGICLLYTYDGADEKRGGTSVGAQSIKKTKLNDHTGDVA